MKSALYHFKVIGSGIKAYLNSYVSDPDSITKEENSEPKLDIVLNEHINMEKYQDENKNKRLFAENYYKDKFHSYFEKPTHVIDNIYLGNSYDAANYNFLQKINAKVVVNVTRDIDNYYPDYFTYINIDIKDNNNESIFEYLQSTYDKIKYHQKNMKPDETIFIHCFAGMSRSASMVIYYLMKELKISYEEALAKLKEKRPIVNPSFRFAKDVIKCYKLNEENL